MALLRTSRDLRGPSCAGAPATAPSKSASARPSQQPRWGRRNRLALDGVMARLVATRGLLLSSYPRWSFPRDTTTPAAFVPMIGSAPYRDGATTLGRPSRKPGPPRHGQARPPPRPGL